MAVDSLWSLAQIAAGFALCVALGFGAAYGLLPAGLRRYALVVAPGAGYALFCLAAVTASVNFRWPANTAVWAACVPLLGASLGAFAAARRRGELRDTWLAARPAALAVPLMLVFVFWPVIYQGTSLYLGTANIDFYQSLAYQEVLTRFGIGALDPRPAIDYSLDPFFGTFPDPVPAKFGGVMFAMLLQKALFMEPRAALMAALVVFLLALPAATYFFARTALAMDERVSALSAGLIAVSAPVTMSFIHVLVGQNSSLALLPLGLAICYLAVRHRDWRLLVFAFLLLDAVFWMYVAILPYIGAPVGLYALYDLARNRRGALRWLGLAVGLFAGIFVLLQLGMARETRQLVDDMVSLLGRANRTAYIDFLTEISLPLSLGLSSYPISSSVLLARVPASGYMHATVGFIAAALVVLLFYLRWVVAWARRAAPEPRAMGAATLGVYLGVWLYFNFISQYGYAIFKMAAWLQFFFVPFVAYGLVRFAAERTQGSRLARGEKAVGLGVGVLVVAANVVATIDFGIKGLGRDTHRGAIVNSYGIGGNTDYLRLESELKRVVPPGSVVGIAMPDFIANLWTSYYVERAGLKASLVSHDDFPDEDAVLPDVATGRFVNSAGHLLVYKPRYHAERPHYLLLEGPANLNREVTDHKPPAQPLWSNESFTLVDAARARDVLVTGRGFYRLEYFDRERFAWWWPERMRWSAEGGEFLLVNASRPQDEHRLSFVAVAGRDRERARHLDIYLNGRKIDEVVVHGAARVVSKPFHPTGGVDKLVVKVRETVVAAPRNFGLWNRDIAIEARLLNILVAEARVSSGEGAAAALPLPARLQARDLIDRSRRFDGISLDGWIAPGAFAELQLRDPARKVTVNAMVPAWAGIRFPVVLRLAVNGRRTERTVEQAGEYTLAVEVPPAAGLAIELDASQSVPLEGIGIAAFRLQSLAIE